MGSTNAIFDLMNGEGAHAEAPAATTTRVPKHLTMTMEELLPTDNISSTHRLVERQRESTNAIFDLMNGESAHAEAPAATTTRVPKHLTMTMEELLATDNILSTHRLVERQRESTNAIFDLMNGEGGQSPTEATMPPRASVF